MKITYFFSALYDNFRLVTSLCFHTVLLFISLSCWTRCFSNISYLNQVCSISSLCWFAVTQKAPVSAAIFQLFFFLTQKLFQPSKAGREKQIIYGRQRESQTCSLSNSTICAIWVCRHARHSIVISASDDEITEPVSQAGPGADQITDLAYVICKMISVM